MAFWCGRKPGMSAMRRKSAVVPTGNNQVSDCRVFSSTPFPKRFANLGNGRIELRPKPTQ